MKQSWLFLRFTLSGIILGAAVGVMIFMLILRREQPPHDPLGILEKFETASDEREGPLFRTVLFATAKTKNGRTLCTMHVEKRDGTKLFRVVESCGSGSEASKRLHEMIGDASRLVERGTRWDGDGGVISERAVIITAEGAIIAWTVGDDLYSIHAKSLGDALAFEGKTWWGPAAPQLEPDDRN